MKLDRFEVFFYIVIVALILLLVASARAARQAADFQTGGAFTLEKTAVAAKRFQFNQATQIRQVSEVAASVNFVAVENPSNEINLPAQNYEPQNLGDNHSE